MADLLITHVEIPVTDLEKSGKFYNDVFGWNFKPFGHGYLLYNNHKGIMVGMRKVEDVSTGDTTVFHLNVNDIESTLTDVEKHGGTTKREKTVIPAMGWYALLTDPDGNTIGLYQKN
ncbi:MAG: VOC family protein [Ignavibacteria bacterium]|jgi:predicted enzyme related to lactoylglutathione lyase